MKHSISDKITQWGLITIGLLIIGTLIYALVTQEDAETNFFNWLRTMAPIIVASATLALALAAFKSINKQKEERIAERQRKALERIRSWAEETFENISKGKGHGFEGINPVVTIMQERLRVAKGKLLSSLVKSIGIETEAKQLGGDVAKEVELAIKKLSKHVGRLGTTEDTVQFREFIGDKDFGDELKPFNSLEEVTTAEKEIMDQLKEVIDSATKTLVPSQ